MYDKKGLWLDTHGRNFPVEDTNRKNRKAQLMELYGGSS